MGFDPENPVDVHLRHDRFPLRQGTHRQVHAAERSRGVAKQTRLMKKISREG